MVAASGHDYTTDGVSQEVVVDNRVVNLLPVGKAEECYEVPLPKESDDLKSLMAIDSGSALHTISLQSADDDNFGFRDVESAVRANCAGHSHADVHADSYADDAIHGQLLPGSGDLALEGIDCSLHSNGSELQFGSCQPTPAYSPMVDADVPFEGVCELGSAPNPLADLDPDFELDPDITPDSISQISQKYSLDGKCHVGIDSGSHGISLDVGCEGRVQEVPMCKEAQTTCRTFREMVAM